MSVVTPPEAEGVKRLVVLAGEFWVENPNTS